jgi:hypothetical protein
LRRKTSLFMMECLELDVFTMIVDTVKSDV